MQAGEAVFVQSCSACHLRSDPSSPRDYPQLGGDTLVMGRDPATVLRIVLAGAQSAVTPNSTTGYSMPSFGALTDQEIADVTTYIRNAWGNRASPVSPKSVRNLRKTISSEAD
jgi:mono/diheme cytochrome c family protein